MRLLGKILGSVVSLLLVVVAGGFLVSSSKLERHYALDAKIPPIPSDPASIERGRHLARAIAKCVDCHGDDLGGRDFIDAGAIGHVWAPNLTRGRGGAGALLTEAQWVNAVRRGLAPDGRGLLIMPSDEYQHLTDEDLGAIIAYVRSVPPVDRAFPTSRLGPLGRALYLAGKFPAVPAEAVDHTSYPPAHVEAGPTEAYGRYLANVGGCTGCHGPGLSGGPIPGMPPEAKPAANLTPTGIGRYSEADFTRILRDGKRPDGTAIDSLMPYKLTREMTDDEIRAVYTFLRTVPAKEFGNR
jgi:mono/diheme cytochrome c family protein